MYRVDLAEEHAGPEESHFPHVAPGQSEDHEEGDGDQADSCRELRCAEVGHEEEERAFELYRDGPEMNVVTGHGPVEVGEEVEKVVHAVEPVFHLEI